ncbi:GIY-YIG nuclease family protein [Vibrio harveyi]|uniref:GIY-YIG nuclease family protein n=1 Tax=Vibrio harveyi TaxID=669 RepID=UPI00390B6B94
MSFKDFNTGTKSIIELDGQTLQIVGTSKEMADWMGTQHDTIRTALFRVYGNGPLVPFRSTYVATTNRVAECVLLTEEMVARVLKNLKIKPKKSGLYIIQCGNIDTAFKIGYTSDIEATIDDLQRGSPLPLVVRNLVKTPLAKKTTDRLHTFFWNRESTHGWFEVPYDEIIAKANQVHAELATTANAKKTEA